MIKEIKFTDKALKQINSLLSKKDEGSFFRIAIKGGGCSGFQYEFSFEKNKNDDDLSFENILIDQTSADLLKGSEVDYVSELIGESFKITNPQTKSSCGCGVSFSLLMIISSWNVNSVRARIENIKSYLLKYKPDIVMMQEIKTEDINFPYDQFSSMDYESHVFGQKSYNGVAIISKHKLKNIRTDLIKDKLKQSRIISAEVEFKKKVIQLINIYTPNGNPVDTEKYD
jgi:iron-sulfur cluster assembly accessory protein